MAKKKAANASGAASKILVKLNNQPSGKKLASRSDIPIEHCFPEDQRAVFSNHFVVQHENGMYHLLFFQINAPLIVGTHEEKASQLQSVKNVRASCTERIVVAEELLPKIIAALQENYETQQARAAGKLEVVNLNSTKMITNE